MGSHNLQGKMALRSSDYDLTRASIKSFADLYLSQKLDVVLLQETFLGDADDLAAGVQAEFAKHGYKLVLGRSRPRTRSHKRACGGTGVLIRQSMLEPAAEGEAPLAKLGAEVVRADDDRSLEISLSWGGHRLRLASHYLPSGKPDEQIAYITDRLGPAAEAAVLSEAAVIWGGDFNFVLDRRLDTLAERVPGQPLPRPDDERVLRHWQLVGCHRMVDTLRTRRPASRAISRAASRARIDRIHVSPVLLPYLVKAEILSATISDHRIVVAHLVPTPVAASITRGPGRFMLPLGFMDHKQTDDAYQAWVEEWAKVPADATPAELVLWYTTQWPRLIAKVQACNGAAKRAREAARAAATPVARLEELNHLMETEGAELGEVIALQNELHAAMLQDSIQDNRNARRAHWLHHGENPCPALTRAVHRLSGRPGGFPAVRDNDGLLRTDPHQMVEAVISFTAKISQGRPEETPDVVAAREQAQATVREALHSAGHPTRMQAASRAALSLGGQAVTPRQVRRAMKTSASGKSPGPDGIPLALYRHSRDVFSPLLARLYTAFLRAGQLPANFNDGLITYIYKKAGDRTEVGNYRPITLLNTTYRLFAKVLADVLNPALAASINVGQTAFLRGRRISDTIATIQMAQQLLEQRGHWGFAVFADFTKAYDTIDRDFLYDVMSVMGVPAEFIAATRLLLHETSASATLNGFVSKLAEFRAGIRQGCPLAPLLYLFVAEALLCIIQHMSDGAVGLKFLVRPYESPDLLAVTVPAGMQAGHPVELCKESTTITAPQFADDITPLILAAPTACGTAAGVESAGGRLALLNSAFTVFGLASNQQLNAAKTHLLPVGRLPPNYRQLIPVGASVSGFTVVDSADTLGVAFSKGGGGTILLSEIDEAGHDERGAWSTKDEERCLRVEATMTRIRSLPAVSFLGRGIASGAYGTSQLLHSLEFRSLPPALTLRRVTMAATRVLSDPPPKNGTRRFFPIRHDYALGRPAEGGCGVLPCREHVRGRHAMMLVRALRMPDAPWSRLLQHLLSGIHPALHMLGLFKHPLENGGSRRSRQLGTDPDGALNFLPPIMVPKHNAAPAADRRLPEIVGRLAGAARALGVLRLLQGKAPLDPQAPDLSEAGTQAWAMLTPHGAQAWRLAPQAYVACRAVCAHADELVSRVGFTLPRKGKPLGVDEIKVLLIQPDTATGTADVPMGGGRPIAMRGGAQTKGPPKPDGIWMTVRAGTQLQLCLAAAMDVERNPAVAWAQFRAVMAGSYHDGEIALPAAVDAVGQRQPRPRRHHVRPIPSVAEVDAARVALAPCFATVWRLRMENRTKEAWWRLVYNGFKTAARLHMMQICCPGCPAVRGPPGRPHTFWACGVARAIIVEIRAALPAGTALERQHVWGLVPPSADVHRQLWAMICVAAVHAMERGRCVLARLHLTAVATEAATAAAAAAAAGAAEDNSASDTASDTSSESSLVADSDADFSPAALSAREHALAIGATAARAAVAVFYRQLALTADLNTALLGKFTPVQLESHPLLRPQPVGPAAGAMADKQRWALRVVVPLGRRLPTTLADVAFHPPA